jgi:hypothetical protein
MLFSQRLLCLLLLNFPKGKRKSPIIGMNKAVLVKINFNKSFCQVNFFVLNRFACVINNAIERPQVISRCSANNVTIKTVKRCYKIYNKTFCTVLKLPDGLSEKLNPRKKGITPA